MTSASGVRIWAVLPAAGIGSRMRSDRPKQYLPLAGQAVLAHSVRAVLASPVVCGAMLALHPQDHYWPALDLSVQKPLHTTTGGVERADSVLAALNALLSHHDAEQDWALVHDAARPLLDVDSLQRLINHAGPESGTEGGLLAIPVRDTLKRADNNACAMMTVDRTHLWQAQTPQLFPIGRLRQALMQGMSHGLAITDEASAMEAIGLQPQLVPGSARNLKITQPEDLAIAEALIRL